MSCSKIGFTVNGSCCLDSFGRAAAQPAFKYQNHLQRLIIATRTPIRPISVVNGATETVLGICYLQEGAAAYHQGYSSANDQLRDPGKMLQSWQ